MLVVTGLVKLDFTVSSDGQGSHPDDLSISVSQCFYLALMVEYVFPLSTSRVSGIVDGSYSSCSASILLLL